MLRVPDPPPGTRSHSPADPPDFCPNAAGGPTHITRVLKTLREFHPLGGWPEFFTVLQSSSRSEHIWVIIKPFGISGAKQVF